MTRLVTDRRLDKNMDFDTWIPSEADENEGFFCNIKQKIKQRSHPCPNVLKIPEIFETQTLKFEYNFRSVLMSRYLDQNTLSMHINYELDAMFCYFQAQMHFGRLLMPC